MGVGILVPMDSPIGMLFGLIAIFIIIIFIFLGLAGLISGIVNFFVGIIKKIRVMQLHFYVLYSGRFQEIYILKKVKRV